MALLGAKKISIVIDHKLAECTDADHLVNIWRFLKIGLNSSYFETIETQYKHDINLTRCGLKFDSKLPVS